MTLQAGDAYQLHTYVPGFGDTNQATLLMYNTGAFDLSATPFSVGSGSYQLTVNVQNNNGANIIVPDFYVQYSAIGTIMTGSG